MKSKPNSNAGLKARSTRLRFQRLRKSANQVDRLKNLLKPVSFEEE